MKKLLTALAALTIVLTLCACSAGEISGTWVYTYPDGDCDSMSFDRDGKYKFSFWDGEIAEGSYKVSSKRGGTLTVKLTDAAGETQDISVDVEGNVLTFGGDDFVKQ